MGREHPNYPLHYPVKKYAGPNLQTWRAAMVAWLGLLEFLATLGSHVAGFRKLSEKRSCASNGPADTGPRVRQALERVSI